MHTIAIYFDKANRVYVFCSDGQERCRSDTRIRHFPSSGKLVLRTSVGFENPIYAYAFNAVNKTMPSEKMFQTAFVRHAYDYALFSQS